MLAYFLAEFSLLFLVLALKLYYLYVHMHFTFFIEFKDSAAFHTHTAIHMQTCVPHATKFYPPSSRRSS